MMDLGLGGPVIVERNPNATHPGPCYDGVYGCHKCHNADNNNRGAVDECEYCGRFTFTKIIKAHDEPVMYAVCKACRDVQMANEQCEIAFDEPDMDYRQCEATLKKCRAIRDSLKDQPDPEAEALRGK